MAEIDINNIVIHCSATKEGLWVNAATIDKWHKRRGWRGIGYHYVILLDGTIEEGRPVLQQGAHVKGHNKNSIGICYIGGLDENMNPKDTRTTEQISAMAGLVLTLKQKYPKADIKGHRDFPGVAKACPCFDVSKWMEEIQ